MTEPPGDEAGGKSPEPRCTSCGRPLAGTDHRRCELDPPRLCPRCGRRMRVQVLPLSYRATCPACDGDAGPRPR